MQYLFWFVYSGIDIIDEDSHENAMDHAVTSIKRNGVAIKGKVTVHCTVITDYCN
jgi:hypothetical protein